MANPPEGLSDDFFEQILAIPPAYASGAGAGASEPPGMAVLQLSSGEGSGHVPGGGGFPTPMFPLSLSLEPDVVSGAGKRFRDESEAKAAAGKLEREPIHLGSVFPPFVHVNSHSVRAAQPPQSQVTPPLRRSDSPAHLPTYQCHFRYFGLFHGHIHNCCEMGPRSGRRPTGT